VNGRLDVAAHSQDFFVQFLKLNGKLSQIQPPESFGLLCPRRIGREARPTYPNLPVM